MEELERVILETAKAWEGEGGRRGRDKTDHWGSR
jgi:hypothetical protein